MGLSPPRIGTRESNCARRLFGALPCRPESHWTEARSAVGNRHAVSSDPIPAREVDHRARRRRCALASFPGLFRRRLLRRQPRHGRRLHGHGRFQEQRWCNRVRRRSNSNGRSNLLGWHCPAGFRWRGRGRRKWREGQRRNDLQQRCALGRPGRRRRQEQLGRSSRLGRPSRIRWPSWRGHAGGLRRQGRIGRPVSLGWTNRQRRSLWHRRSDLYRRHHDRRLPERRARARQHSPYDPKRWQEPVLPTSRSEQVHGKDGGAAPR